MPGSSGSSVKSRTTLLATIAPGLAKLLQYRKSDLPHDLVAGLSVAAVALPVGVAYAQLAGFNPAVGLYSSILPLVAYAIFGTSRQLIMGPDAATCALVALSVLSMLGVVAVGAIHAILVAVVLAILRFVRLVSRPKVEIL